MNTKHIFNSVKILILLAGFLCSLPFYYMQAQENDNPILNTAEKKQVVDSIALFMTDYYVFPDVGLAMGETIGKKLADGGYDAFENYPAFAGELTDDLRSVSKDLHIGVRYAPEMIAMMNRADADENNTELEDLRRREAAYSNYNFKEARILPGNVGYLKFNSFMDAAAAGPTAVAALNFLSHTDALIIDLRDNGGGSPSLIQLITTYFFEESHHLNSFYIREGEQTRQFWTLPYVPGNKLSETDLYILTSGNTFSGAEEFTYNLKNLERATVVGETTGGGAHPVSMHVVNDNFTISIPFGRAVNPITGTNWEGTGVEPHIKTTREEALDKAYMLALENRMTDEQDETQKASLKWVHEGLLAKSSPVSVSEETLRSYAGTYGPRILTWEDGTLYYQRENRPKMKMIPMTESLFRFEELDYFRLKVVVEDGKPVAVEGQYDNGRTDRNPKS